MRLVNDNTVLQLISSEHYLKHAKLFYGMYLINIPLVLRRLFIVNRNVVINNKNCCATMLTMMVPASQRVPR